MNTQGLKTPALSYSFPLPWASDHENNIYLSFQLFIYFFFFTAGIFQNPTYEQVATLGFTTVRLTLSFHYNFTSSLLFTSN